MGGTGRRAEPKKEVKNERRDDDGDRGGWRRRKGRDETNHLEHETKKKNFCASLTSYLAKETGCQE